MLLFFRHYRCLLERVRKSNEDDKEITYKNKRRTQFNNLINFDIIKLFLDFNTLCFLLQYYIIIFVNYFCLEELFVQIKFVYNKNK